MSRLTDKFPGLASRRLQITAGYVVLWLVFLADWRWSQWIWPWLQAAVFGTSMPVCGWWVLRFRARRAENAIAYSAVRSLAFVPLWQLSVFAADLLEWTSVRANLARFGTAALFFIGLGWVVWFVERASEKFDRARLKARADQWKPNAPHGRRSLESEPVSNHPLDSHAWYYGKKNPRLNQSISALSSYSLLFLLAFLVFTQVGGCQELYEMPAGGGEQKQIAQTVKVQKVIRKKFVVNPFSPISFKVPEIDEVKLQLTEITEHAYTVGYGAGTGAGFAGGTKQGMVRFIRVEYPGGDWDQDFGVGADLNMLIQYGIRTKQKIAKRTESRTIAQLKNFPVGKSPPMVYMTGQKNISLSNNDIKVLREYILDKHGMIFGDNGGSGHFHNQFVGMMRRILPNVRPTRIPLDDTIHRIPYQIPFLPFVAPHGGKDALGWRVDGRLVCYYHPGDIGDAWTDDHSGVSPEIWEACYQLGTNVIFYAHTEYSKWLQAQKKE